MGGKRKLDKIIVIDLEATCWDNEEERNGQPSEIIEIGACFLNIQTGEPEKKTSYLIKPTRSTISKFCTELTTITPNMIKKQGTQFEHAINRLIKDFGPAQRTWASWGAYDREELINGCIANGISYPMGKNHFNAKNLFAFKYKLKEELGLPKALEMLGLEMEGTLHRGHDDAWNIAKILSEILELQSFRHTPLVFPFHNTVEVKNV